MILIDDQIPLLHDVLAPYGPTGLFAGRSLTRELLIDINVSAVFVRSTTPIHADLLRGTHVRFIGSATAGIDHVDLAWLQQHGIRFAYAPGSNAWAVAEYVYAWITTCHLQPHSVVGIIGHGHVGSRLDRALLHFGHTVKVYDPPKYGHGRAEFEELLRTSDVVTLHVPFTSTGLHATVGMLGKAELELLRPSTVLIQTSRGGVVDDDAVAQRVANGLLRAVYDVYATEPNVPAAFVETIGNCTPHIAGYSLNAKVEGARMVAESFLQKTLPELRQPPMLDNQHKAGLRDVVAEAAWFRTAYVADARGKMFDALRKSYELQPEVLSTMLANRA